MPYLQSAIAKLDHCKLQAYVRSHILTSIYVLDFLKYAKARGDEKLEVENIILALQRLLTQVGQVGALIAGCLGPGTRQRWHAWPCRSSMWLPHRSQRT